MIDNLSFWLAATHLRGMSSRTFMQWHAIFPDIKGMFSKSRAELAGFGMSAKHINALLEPDWREVDKALLWSQELGNHLVTITDKHYPQLLKQIYDPPLVLYVRGDPDILCMPQVAMVGSRHASPIGIKNAEQFAGQLTRFGYAITSGLASGIDAASHRGALSAGGKTLAVIGTGQHCIYPVSNRALHEQIIASQGAVVSEFSLDTKPVAYHFPMRNRIIAGLSMGVLVVEAAIKSGSLITARLAMEEGREVFAIPGSIHHVQSRGCHKLIREGVKLVETAADIVEEIGALKAIALSLPEPKTGRNLKQKIPAKELQILEQIEYAVTPLDEIILRSGLTISEVSAILLSLELSGYVQSLPGGYMRIDTF
jgi:DNA processing protein